MQKERFRKHPDFPNYRFSDSGRVQNIQPISIAYRNGTKYEVINRGFMQFLKPRKHPQWDLYMINPVHKNGGQRTIFPHKMTALLFVKNPKKKKHVWFRDDNKNNCFYTNLFWVDQGDLNHIQQRLGQRDMAKQAARMRKHQKATKPKPCFLFNSKNVFIEKHPSLTSVAKKLKGTTAGVSYAFKNKTIYYNHYIRSKK